MVSYKVRLVAYQQYSVNFAIHATFERIDRHMNSSQENIKSFGKIPAFDYKGGKSVTSKLCEILHLNEFQDLSDVFDIPRGTISTWHTRDTTPFEISIRFHLATGASLRWLLLDEGEAYPDSETPICVSSSSTSTEIPKFRIQQGKLCNEGAINLDSSFLPEHSNEYISLVDGNKTLFIDKSETTLISGKYLLAIDDLISINDIQRLPGKRIAMSFGDSTIEVSDADITVLGRVVMTLNKE